MACSQHAYMKIPNPISTLLRRQLVSPILQIRIISYGQCRSLICLAMIVLAFSSAISAQKMDRIEKDRTIAMLHSVKNAIKKDYYDPDFHGINLDPRFAAAEDKLKGTDDLGKALGIIAQAVLDLNDSHTTFY